ncbi:MAG: type III-B CRISPR-associated protein Cas10/Cmr2 [Thaumarchaeota archaeon]|nr:type III-B CRISPR-associated protein Cas10/Cmr2 [Nitrososphaerota archaeon]
MKTYTALTIGPIYKTLGNARHTRELWAASYTFSYLMKEIITEVNKDGKWTIVLPHLPADSSEKYGEGVLPDRLICETPDGSDVSNFRKITDKVVSRFADSVAGHFKDWNHVMLLEFLKGYFRFYIIQKQLRDDQNIVLELYPLLDALELQANYSPNHEKFLESFFNRINSTFLVNDGYAMDRVRYDTLVEVAARQFMGKEAYDKLKTRRKADKYATPEKSDPETDDAIARKDDTELIGELKLKYKEDFRAAHKYVAIVHSDGDNIGAIIKGLRNDQFPEFSKLLGEFSRDAAKLIDERGGMPIYAGGDDLLFFSPVINGEKHVLHLLSELDRRFIAKFKAYRTSPPPSLSFGVSISYYKYPLFEALEASRGLLHKVKQEKKHSIALRVMKHSGQTFETSLHLRSRYFNQFERMLREHVASEASILSSLVYKIEDNQKLFSLMGREPERVKNFIKNSFNEPVHERDDIDRFLDQVKLLISTVFAETADDEKALDRIYTMLRTISFFKEKDER